VVGGCLTAGVLAVGFLAGASRNEAPFVIALFGVFIFGFVAVTRRRVPVAPGAITAGGIVGVLAALVPAVAFMLRPPVPASTGWAFVALAAAMAAAVAVSGLRGGFRFFNAVLSGLLAAVVAALLIAPVVGTMAQFGPESWVPRMESHALTPAARLAERRDVAGEPYLLVLLFGAVLAVLLGVLALRTRDRVRATPRRRPVDGPGHIELGEF
jgi:hypothetical protein